MYVNDDLQKRVIIHDAMRAEKFFKTTKEKFGLIFAGNVENNLLFQKGFSRKISQQLHDDIYNTLTDTGIYACTTNEVFFHNTRKGSAKNSKLEILYKFNQCYDVVRRPFGLILAENCCVIAAKKGYYDTCPKSDLVIEVLTKKLSHFKYLEDLTVTEGTMSEFLQTVYRNETNIAIVKISKNKYIWFNSPKKYKELAVKLASLPKGFYPELYRI
jgi:hypothetical protein